jgi:DNA modification methylase
MQNEILNTDCLRFLKEYKGQPFDLTFLDPPFNQDKDYHGYDDGLDPKVYWAWMSDILQQVYDHTSLGGAIYFMQREKNVKMVMESLEGTGWYYQNLIIWKKKTSAVPGSARFGKHYQIIAFFTKGGSPRIFNKLRIDLPLLPNEKLPRESGVFLTDVWDDIRELTSGYFAGDEAIRNSDGSRFHKQQAPIKLLARIILTSSMPGDLVFDPFAGTGTTLVVAKQLNRNLLGLDISPANVELTLSRLTNIRKSDVINKMRPDYRFTVNLDAIWPSAGDYVGVFKTPQSNSILNLFTPTKS